MKIGNIVVKTVNKEKLIDFLAIPLNPNEELVIDTFAVYEQKFGIDTDCCFWEIHQGYFNNKIQPVIDIECRIKRHKGGNSYTIRMDKADFFKTISLEDYLSLAEEVKLIDFIRYNYNPRIKGNQKLLMKYIKESAVVAS